MAAHHNLLNQLQARFPALQFVAGNGFCWSHAKRSVTYHPQELRRPEGQWALLHETAHGLLEHATYQTDFELVTLEVAAWERATHLAAEFDIAIDAEHIQDCLDTYRDWLHRRSTCPTCGSVSLQHTAAEYRCHNCLATWRVTAERFCRPYRRRITTTV